MQIRFFLITLFVRFAIVSAQDSLTDENALDTGAFNQTVSTGKKADDKNKLEYLPGVFFVSEADEYKSSAGYGSNVQFYGKAYLKATKADIGSLYAGFNFNYFLYAAADNPFFRAFYQLQKPDPSLVSASLSELHFSFDVDKLVFVRIGKQLISWGASYFWTPEDFINMQQAQPTVLSVVDIRKGKPGLRIHIPLHSANLFLFTDFSSIVVPGQPIGTLAETIGQAWRLDGVIAGVNLGTVGYASKNGPTHIGFDATGNALATDIYGELALNMAKKNYYTPTYAYSIGAAHPFGKEKNWTGRGEFYYNDTGYADTKLSTLPPGAFTPFYSGKYYAYGEISGTELLSTTLDVSLFALINLADLSYSPTIQCTIDLPGVLPFTIFARYFGGRSDREFTSAFGGSAWQVGARIVVDL